MEPKEQATAVHLCLLEFYGTPEWRNPLPPLDELVSTILSQNTNDTNRDRAYQAIGLMPGALYPGSLAAGITLKISDGDARGKIRQAVALEALRQLGVLSADEIASLASFGPCWPVYNWRKLTVGEGHPVFHLATAI